ncbi:hypothetical protein J1N35_024170 [Gossypium stocksii]|uniref:Uncharacterized protein n=1 Tax=Gossypium stocksii TaxID=47602 RepID=A0A9D3VLL7_9ROSI|nr:hypothetical protein J1N35_024170 [Gossypium stocksii]
MTCMNHSSSNSGFHATFLPKTQREDVVQIEDASPHYPGSIPGTMQKTETIVVSSSFSHASLWPLKSPHSSAPNTGQIPTLRENP